MEIKRVQYSYNSNLEGLEPYSLSAFVLKDGKTLVNVSKTFKTRDEFFQELEEIIPVMEVSDEN